MANIYTFAPVIHTDFSAIIFLDVPKERQLDVLMERLRSKALHFKSWTENAKALRMALMDKRHILDSTERIQLQKCLDTLQKSIKVTSLQSMVERLESISRQLGLKFTAGPSGTDCFISSDMFYVEVLLESTGTVKDVKIAHHGDPVSCPELSEVLSKWDFAEFTKHLEGLSAIYQLNADKKQKSKAYLALQALETDLTMLSQLQSSINDPCNLVHKSPVGILQTRRGGHPMKLTYFISPYDLLDMESKALMPLTVDAVVERQLGYSVMVCIESSMAHKLQTQSLMSISRTSDGKSLPSFAAPSNLNSTTLPANFVLRLDSPMPIAIALVRKIQAVTHIECADLSTSQPLLSLITQRVSKGELDCHSRGLFVTLPDQHHCYFLSGGSDLQGVMVSSIPFTHPTHVPQILIFLRQQALFNVLISSCIRPYSKQDLETALMFEVSALSWLHITVAFEHPIEESMATAEFDLSDITNVKCKLHTMPNDTPICTDEYASKVIQRCLSIPITMRAVIRKAHGQQQQQRMNHTNGDMLINLVPNGSGNLLGHPSPFSEAGGGSKFVTDFDVKLNGRGSDGMSDSSSVPKLDVLNASMSYGMSSELNQNSLGLDTQGFLDGTPPSASSTQGDLFSIPPERASSLTNPTPSPLGNMLSQAAPQPSPSPQPIPPSSITPSQGKPNAMLMNLLHDFPQCMPLAEDSQQQQSLPPRQTSPAPSPPLPQYQGKPNAMLMNLLHEFPECLPMDGKGGSAATQGSKIRKQRKRKSTTDASSPRSTTGRSPKRKPSQDDCSKDLPTPDVESSDSISMSFDISTAVGGNNGQSSASFLTPVTSSGDTHLPKSFLSDTSNTSNRTVGDGISGSTQEQEQQQRTLIITDSISTSAIGNNTTSENAQLASSNRGSAVFGEYGAEMLTSHAANLESNVSADDDDDFSLESCPSDTFTISSSSGSTIKLASSSLEKFKGNKKAKRFKFETGHKPEEKDIPLGKEIEKIPIVLDITSVSDSKPPEISRSVEHYDRRPNVEIIPLGTSMTAPSIHHTSSGMSMFNSSIKITKPSLEGSKKESKLKQRDLRRIPSEILDRKNKLEGKKERKRKRLDGVDSIGLESAIRPPKIINVITPIPTSHSGMTTLEKAVSIVSHSHKPLEIPVSRPVTLNVKPPLTSPTNSNISVSVTKTVVTPTSASKKSIIPSPNISPTLSISPNKSVSILKTTQSIKPKPPLNRTSCSSIVKSTSADISSGKSSDIVNTKVTISPLKVQNKNKQSLTVKNGAQTLQGGLSAAKVPTKPATVKLKQLNLSSVSASSPAIVASSSNPRNTSSPLSKISSHSSVLPGNSATVSPVSSSSTASATASGSSCNTTLVSVATPLPSKAQSSLLQANLALLAAQKASKLAARSRKGSLSAVIDKLMASSMQHTGGIGENVPTGGRKSDGSSKMDGVIERKESKGEKKDALLGGAQKGGESRMSKSNFSDGKLLEGKKAEFTVKQSSQGIKLTVTKTHCTEGGMKLSSSIKGSAARSSGSKSLSSSPSSLNKAGGSATGLKPGVNSGPASKKGVAPVGPSGPKNPAGQPKGSLSLSSSPKTSLPLSTLPQSHTVSHSITMTSPKMSSSVVNSVTKTVPKHSSSDGKQPIPIIKSQDKIAKLSSQEARPSTPKNAIAMPVSTMPPPPPPPDLVVQTKKGDDSPLRHSPIRSFTKHSRDSPVEESETERAFQRLLQAQGSSANLLKPINGPTDAISANKVEGPRTPKSDLSNKSPKHSSSDGRSTPKSVLLEKMSAPSPNLNTIATTAKVALLDMKRPPTPKSDILNKIENSIVTILSPVESPASMSSSSKGGTPKPAPKLKQPPSPGAKDSSSPEDELVIDCPSIPCQKSPDRKLSKPVLPLPGLEPVNNPIKSPADLRMPISPSIQQLKSPAQPSPAIRSPILVNTPQSEHSNPSSVAHSSPYDIDDELMDEALVGLGK